MAFVKCDISTDPICMVERVRVTIGDDVIADTGGDVVEHDKATGVVRCYRQGEMVSILRPSKVFDHRRVF